MRGSPDVERTVLEDGTIRLAAKRCVFLFSRPGLGQILIRISGFDSGALGSAPFDELGALAGGETRVELFVDASDAAGASWEVSDKWTRFFRKSASALKRVHILAPSKFVHQTISVAKLFSRTGDLIQVYTAAEEFRARMAAS